MEKKEAVKEVRAVASALKRVASGLQAGATLLEDDSPILVEGLHERVLSALNETVGQVEAGSRRLDRALKLLNAIERQRADEDLFLRVDSAEEGS